MVSESTPSISFKVIEKKRKTNELEQFGSYNIEDPMEIEHEWIQI